MEHVEAAVRLTQRPEKMRRRIPRGDCPILLPFPDIDSAINFLLAEETLVAIGVTTLTPDQTFDSATTTG